MSSFDFVTPTEADKELINRSRDLFREIEQYINDAKPFHWDQRGFAVALTHLEIASFFLHKALARGAIPKENV